MRSRQAGATLIEIAVAMGVMTVALVGLLSMVLWVSSSGRSASEAEVARKSAQDALERTIALPYTGAGATLVSIGRSPTQEAPFVATKLHPTMQIGRIRVESVDPTLLNNALDGDEIEPAATGTFRMAKITVTVDLRGVSPGGGEVRLVAYRANPGQPIPLPPPPPVAQPPRPPQPVAQVPAPNPQPRPPAPPRPRL